jgi:4a-hydroxytetrahydrobiopterin dehydratase
MFGRKKAFAKKEAEKHLRELSEWKPNAKLTQISKTYAFPSFISGLAFIAKISVHAEVLNHHPTIELSYGNVKVTLTTHSAKGLTKSDFELAGRIEKLTR